VATLYYIRHGETDWNAEGRLQGQRDIGLNAKGRAQAADAGRKLRNLVPNFADVDFIASPLERTRHTMEIAREAAGLDPFSYAMDDRLKEISFGEWEGLTWPELEAREPEKAAAREADKWGYPPPGGESYAMLSERVNPFFNALARDTVVVSHGGVARALLAQLCDVPPERAPHLDIWQGRVIVIQHRKYNWI
jgi:broad specificity phosphatase PhoE